MRRFPRPARRVRRGARRGRPLARIDEALALARQTGERWTDAFLHRIRADILLKADPTNPSAPRKPIARPSPARASKARGPSGCKRRSGSPTSINRPAARPRRTTFLRQRSKASLQQRNCPRSPRRGRCSSKLLTPLSDSKHRLPAKLQFTVLRSFLRGRTRVCSRAPARFPALTAMSGYVDSSHSIVRGGRLLRVDFSLADRGQS